MEELKIISDKVSESDRAIDSNNSCKSIKLVDSETFNKYVNCNNFNNSGKYNKYIKGYNNIKSNIPFKVEPYTMIYGKCHITYAKHNDEKFTSYIFDNPMCEIGSDIIIYPNVTIFGGINVGHGARLLQGSVITNDVKPYSIVDNLGNITFRYNDDIIESLLKLEWWNLSHDIILKNKDLLSSSNSNQSIIDELMLLKK